MGPAAAPQALSPQQPRAGNLSEAPSPWPFAPARVGMSQRSVARSLGLAQGTVSKYLNRTRRAGLTWPLPLELDDDVRLENRLYPPPSDLPSDDRPQPDWAVVHRELRRPGVTLMLLWEEYCDTTSDGFSYSWFCERYKEWAGRLKPTLRQVHCRRRARRRWEASRLLIMAALLWAFGPLRLKLGSGGGSARRRARHCARLWCLSRGKG